MTDDLIPNKVANSGLITISLEDYYPQGQRRQIDIAQWLFEEQILKEKDFRGYIKSHNWEHYRDCYVQVDCSADAIIPQWAYMLISAELSGLAKNYTFGTSEQLESIIYEENLQQADFSVFIDQRVILKGCGDLNIPPHAFMSLTKKLKPIVKSLMYGEACSMVPVYKQRR